MYIQRIRLKNFKAFKDEEVFDVDGKHLLICGNNGSGKSSLHYALHVFFQSSKKGETYKKYFIDSKDKIFGTESLLNIYGDPNDYLIELSVKQDDKKIIKYQIRPTIDVDAESHQHQNIVNSDYASDFICHRLLVNFYNFRNSEDANIWSIFEKEIFPYWIDDVKGITFEQWLNEIKTEFNQLSQETEVIVDDSAIAEDKRLSQKRKKKFNKESPEYKVIQDKIKDFNNKFWAFYNSIKERINEILSHFLTDEKIEVDLDYRVPLDTNQIYEWQWNIPELIIKVKNNGEFIQKPHVFLNEARLTALALSIRLAMFDKKFKGTGSDVIKLLVMDDLLISLDMDFRMKLINYIQEQQNVGGSFEGYQIFILTHDKGLFEVLKNTLAKDVKQWKWFEFFENNKYPIVRSEDYKNPIILEDKSLLEIAEEYLNGVKKNDGSKRIIVKEKSYELCALFLRKQVEQILKCFFDPECKDIFRFKILENLSRGLSEVKNEFTQKQKQSFERLFNLKVDLGKLAELKALKLTPPTGTDEPGKTNIANQFKNSIYIYLEEYHREFASHQNNKINLLNLSKALQEIRSRILNQGAHSNNETIFEMELRGAIGMIKDFNSAVHSITKK